MGRGRAEPAVASHAGRRREQQDAHATHASGGVVVLAVADGMGGHAGGRAAGRIVAEAVERLAASDLSADGAEGALQAAAERANREILAYGREHPGAEGLGSTLVAALVFGARALIAHAGDSRAYLVTREGVEQLTRDHSAVQEAIDWGRMTEEEAESSPYRHAIVRNLGDPDFPGLETDWVDLPDGSALLLTSDGAHGFLTETEILDQMLGSPSLESALDRLLRLAYHNGSDDNITLVGWEHGRLRRSKIEAQEPPRLPRQRKPRARRRGGLAAVAVGVLLLVVLGALGWRLITLLQADGRSSVPPEVSPTPAVETPVPLEPTASPSAPSVWATPLPTPTPPPPEPKPTPSWEEEELVEDSVSEAGSGEVEGQGLDADGARLDGAPAATAAPVVSPVPIPSSPTMRDPSPPTTPEPTQKPEDDLGDPSPTPVPDSSQPAAGATPTTPRGERR